MVKKHKVSSEQLISAYMEYVEQYASRPESIASFTEILKLEEKKFYIHFEDFLELEKVIFKKLFEISVETLVSSDEYSYFDKKGKILSMYFTFFENLSLNRKYVAFILSDYGTSLKTLDVLSLLKETHGNFVDDLNMQTLNINISGLEKIQKISIRESSWVQFLFTLKFWLEDTSPDFEKTDIFIEKLLNTTIDLLETKTLNNLIDLGKFLYKEKFQSE